MTDRAAARGDLAAIAAAAVRGGVDWVQIRDRELSGARLLALAEEIAAAARAAAPDADLRILVNRRADVALAVAADGVHLGFDALGVADARRVVGADALVGVSAHAPEEIGREDADYAHLAPIFTPLSKPAGRAPLGLEALAAAGGAGIPVLAQGGIDPERAAAARAAGAAGVAVSGSILAAPDPQAAAAALRRALDA